MMSTTIERCPVCNARMGEGADGSLKCMNPRCQGAAGAGGRTVQCQCGEAMQYTGLNSWGEPNYVCHSCGETTKL
jgi:hypothetical protein